MTKSHTAGLVSSSTRSAPTKGCSLAPFSKVGFSLVLGGYLSSLPAPRTPAGPQVRRAHGTAPGPEPQARYNAEESRRHPFGTTPGPERPRGAARPNAPARSTQRTGRAASGPQPPLRRPDSPAALGRGEAPGHGARGPPAPGTDLSSESMRLSGSPSEDISRLPRRPPDVALQLLLPLLPPPPPVP